ncbi:MAG: hypothetical protein ACRYHQ_14990 [Janthinobacterium lividum]
MPKAITTPTTAGATAPASTRRRVLGGAALAALTGGAFGAAIVLPNPGEAFPASASPDAELLAACAAFDALEGAYRATNFRAEPYTPEATAAEAEQDRITAAQRPLVARMTELRAVTHEGRVARARSLIGWWPDVMADGEGTTGECLTYATLRDLVGEG